MYIREVQKHRHTYSYIQTDELQNHVGKHKNQAIKIMTLQMIIIIFFLRIYYTGLFKIPRINF